MNKLKLSAIVLTAAVGVTSLLFAADEKPADKVTTPSGLTIITTARSADSGAKAGDHVWVHYAGRLENGTEFDSSFKRGEPIDIDLGAGQVIKGWDEGLVGMHIGEKRQLIIPSDLAYGPEGRGDKIPPNSTLIFDVEMMGILRK